MVIRVGTVIASDFGRGPIVAITDQWIIHKDKEGVEFALSRHDDFFYIPIDRDNCELGGGTETFEREENAES